jgi:hypothetical protein
MTIGDVGIIWRLNPAKTLDMNIADGIAAHYKRTGVPAEIVDVHPEDFKHHLVASRTFYWSMCKKCTS